MKYFWHRHPQLHTRSLWAAVALTSLLGVYQVLAQDRRPIQNVTKDTLFSWGALPKAGSDTPTGPQAPPTIRTVAGTTFTPVLPPYGPQGSGNALGIGQSLNTQRFGSQHWPALLQLWNHESGWNTAARNRSSGACGIPQALPCTKIPDMSPAGQITWGLDYIAARYGNPSNAWQFWQIHHWY